MKKVQFITLIISLLVSCNKEYKTDFKSGILWQINSKNGTESFIFGTFHMYPKGEIILSKDVISSLNQCNVLALEKKPRSQAEHKNLTPFPMPNFVLENHKIIVAEYGDDLVSMERELVEKALESEMKLTGLESTSKTFNIMKELSELKFDENRFANDPVLRNFKESVSQYKTGSIDQYYKNVAARFGNDMTTILIDRRNKDWVVDIENLIKSDQTFIAVGIGHLGGESGILNLLAKKGYQIKKVE